MMKPIQGAKGKGGGASRAAVEAENTLSSRAIVKVVEVLSEGQIVGIAGGAKGIYINDTPLQNSDGSYNFARTSWEYRVGLPDQDYMAGFPSVESEVTVGSTVTTSTPISRTTSNALTDAVKVTISLPQGLTSQDTSNGDLKGTVVEFAIDTKLTSSGTWAQAGAYKIDGKTTTVTEKQYRVERPAGTGTWDVRVRRITADSAVTTLRNQIAFARLTEVQDLKPSYNDTAYVGIAIDAESVGNQIPKRAYLVVGQIVQVPSNYNPVTRTYSGVWNGSFVNAYTDNPAWVLYDLITHPRYGMGEFIDAAQVDKFSFYDAAVYNDELVPDGDGGTEPRFTCNVVLNTREEAFRVLSLIAGAMRGSLIYANGQIKLLQDRPADPVKLVTKANVIDGKFDYRSTGLLERHTAFNVTFNDREDRHLQRVVTIDADTCTSVFKTMLETAQNRYGYNPTDIAALGATTASQATRHGMWALDTELNQTELVQFKMSLNGFDLFPGDIINQWDEDYVAASGAGRIVSVSGTTVVLDRPVTLVAGSKIDVTLADGKTIEQRNVVQTSGSLSTITVSSAFSQAVLPDAVYIMRLAAEPRQFRIMGLRQEEANIISVEAVYHDPAKYGRVENNINVPAPVFSLAQPSVCTAPTNLTFREVQVNNAAEGLGGLRRSLLISWGTPVEGQVKNYVLRYRLNGGEWSTVEPTSPVYEIVPAFAGTYQVDVAAASVQGILGPTVEGSYSVTTVGGSASPLNAPLNLVIPGTGTVFSGPDINFQFKNPTANASVLNATLRDFEVRFIETAGSTTVRTVYIASVPAGSVAPTSYTFAMNTADGGPRRSVQVQVRCRDANNNLSDPITTTFTNPAPAQPSSIAVTPGIGSNKITFTLPTDPDFKGILIWRSTTDGFTPSSGTVVYDGSDNYVADNSLTTGTTYYYRIAAYDAFSKDLTGVTLNVSAQYSAAPIGIASGDIVAGAVLQAKIADGAINTAKFAAGITPVELVSTLPTTGNFVGRVATLTTDGKLYRWNGTAWSAAVAASDVGNGLTSAQINDLAAAKISGQLVASQIADGAITTLKLASGLAAIQIVSSLPGSGTSGQVVFLTTDSQLYRWNGSAWTSAVPAVNVGPGLTAAQITSVSAASVGAGLTAAQITSVNAAAVTGTLSDSQLAGISTAKLIGSVVDGQLAGISAAKVTGTITDAQIASGISASKVSGALSAATLATTALTGTVADTQIAAVATTKLTGTVVDAQIASGIGAAKISGALTAATLAAGSVTGQMSDSQIATLSATKVTGTLTNSQIAALDAAKLTGQIVGTQITDGSVSTPKLAAGSVVADKIAAYSIIASKLAIQDEDSVFPDPSFQDASWWQGGSGGSSTWPTGFSSEFIAGWPQPNALKVAPTSGYRNIFSQGFRVEPNASYRYKVWIFMSGAFAGQVTVLGHWPAAAWHAMGIPTSGVMSDDTSVVKIDNSAIPRDTWIAYETIFTNPAFNGYNNYSNLRVAANTTAGNFYVAIRMVRAANASLIVDGSIIAAKIGAGEVVAGKLAADSVVAGNIVAGAITTAKLAAGAVTANEVAANAITTSKLYITPESYCLDPTFRDPSYWNDIDANGWYYEEFSRGDMGDWRRVVLWSGTSPAVGTARKHMWSRSQNFAAIGQTMRLRAIMRNSANQNVYVTARFLSASGTALGDLTLTSAASSGVTTPTAQAVVPANTTQLRFIVFNEGSTTWAGDAEVSTIKLDIAASADLLVDGTITASKIVAGAITTAKLDAAAVTTAKIAAGAVTAATIGAGEVVAGKLAANSVDASNIVAGTITANKLFIVPESLVYDANFRDSTWWTISSQDSNATDGWYFDAGDLGMSAPGGIVLWSGSGAFANPTRRKHIWGSMFALTGVGQQYRLRARVRNQSNDLIYVGLQYFDSVGTYLGDAYAYSGAGSGNTTISAMLTVPANTARARLIVFNSIVDNSATYSGVACVTEVKLDAAASADLIVDGAITAVKIAAASITGDRLVAGTITAGQIAANTITSAQIAAGAIVAGNIAAGTITGDRLAAATITASQIAAGTITGGQIASGSITASQIAAGTITTGQIAAGTIVAGNIASGTITATQIASSTITATQLAANSVTATQLAANSVVAGKISAGAISATEIAAGAITVNKLAIVPSNICPDPIFNDQEYWGQYADANGWYWEGTHPYLNNQVYTLNAFYSSVGTSRKHRYSYPRRLSGRGTVLRLRARSYNGSNQWLSLGVQFMGPGPYDLISSASLTFPANTDTTQAVQVTVPAAAIYHRFVMYNESGTTFTGGGSITDVTLDVAGTADLIVDGAVIASKIGAGQVTAGKIAANAVTATEILAESITTSRLKIVPQSLCPDGNFNDIDFWTNGSGLAAIAGWDGYGTSGWYLDAGGTGENTTRNITLYSGQPVPPGTARRQVSSRAVPFGGVGQALRLRARCFNVSNQSTLIGVEYFTPAFTYITGNYAYAPASSGMTDQSIQGTVPNNTAYLRFIVCNDGGTTLSGYSRVMDLRCDVAASSELIVDGAVTAAKLTADSVVAGKIAAGAVNSREIAAGSIIATRIAVADQDQVPPDPAFYDAGFWRANDGGTFPSWMVPEADYTPISARRVRFGPSSGGNFDFFTKFFPTEPGAAYRAKIDIYYSASFAGELSLYTHIPSQEWWAMGATTSGTGVAGLPKWAPATRDVWLEFVDTRTFAAGDPRKQAQFRIAGNITAGYAYFYISFVRATNAELIVDGTITANKIQAGTITADRLLANTLTSSQIAANTIVAANIATNTITADRLAADTITANKLSIGARGGASGTLIANSDWTDYAGTNSGIAALPGWVQSNTATGAYIERNYVNGTQWNLGRGGVMLYDTEDGGSGSWGISAKRVRAIDGLTYEMHVKGAVHRCVASITVYWINSAGAAISGVNVFSANPGNASSIGSPYQLDTLIWGTLVAPAGTVWADVYLLKQKTLAGGTNSYAFFNEAYFAPNVSGSSATNPSSFRPTGMVEINGGGLTAATVTADKINVSSLSAVTATIGTLRTATSGGRVEISDNVIKIYDPSNVLRVKIGNLSL